MNLPGLGTSVVASHPGLCTTATLHAPAGGASKPPVCPRPDSWTRHSNLVECEDDMTDIITTAPPISGAATNETAENGILALVERHDMHAIVSGLFYYTDLITGQRVPLKKSGMMLKFKEINNNKKWAQFINILQSNNRVKDFVCDDQNPPPNALHIQNSNRPPNLLELVLCNVLKEWKLGHIVTREIYQYYRFVGGHDVKDENSFGKKIVKYIGDNNLSNWQHKRTGFQIGSEKHLVGWKNTDTSDDNADITIVPDRRGKSWGIVHRVTGLALVQKLSLDFAFEVDATSE